MAHSANSQLQGIALGVMHSLTDVKAVLPLIVAALFMGQQSLSNERRGLTLLLVLLASIIVGMSIPNWYSQPWTAAIFPGQLLVLGLLVCIARIYPTTACALVVGVFGFIAGSAQGQEFAFVWSSALTLLGVLLFYAAMAAFGIVANAEAKQHWMRIAVRVVGRWAAAAGIMLLVL